MSAVQFERHLTVLRERYQVVPLPQLVEELASGIFSSPRQIAITFDDGYQDNHKFVLPILKRFNVRASFFLIAEGIGSTQEFWWHRLERIIRRCSMDSLLFDQTRYPLTTPTDRRNTILFLFSALRDLYGEEKERMLAKLSRMAGVEDGPPNEDNFLMSWDQVFDMVRAGMHIGSHTCTHPRLSCLPHPQLVRELAESRRVLEEQLRISVTAIAYPYGHRADVPDTIGMVAKSAGYHYGLSTETGINRRGRDPFMLRRLNVSGWDSEEFAFRIAREFLS
jgi:peptidoglycan/xylan/chitin deacetylase (PgdA/CDA1 family)